MHNNSLSARVLPNGTQAIIKSPLMYIGLRLPGYHWEVPWVTTTPSQCITNVHIGLGLPGYYWGVHWVTTNPCALLMHT